MYPADDRVIRIRLLLKEGRDLRLRLAERIGKSQALRARAVRLCSRADAARQAGAHPEWWGPARDID